MSFSKTALISVTNKNGLIPFAKKLVEFHWEIISTGGTAKELDSSDIPYIPIEAVTGNPEAFDGRMKSISFQIESGILFDRDNPSHRKEAEDLKIRPIDMVVCNFYPFPTDDSMLYETELKKGIELIDIGGPTMVRAAAKNFRHCLTVVNPDDYDLVINLLEKNNKIEESIHLMLAAKAFQYVADYDSTIDKYFAWKSQNELIIRYRFSAGKKLRYGENPHQKGYYYTSDIDDPLSIGHCTQLNGKELSFNNILDLDSVIYFISINTGEEPKAIIVKHTNPCGAAESQTIEESFQKAWEGDTLAAFGGIAGLNKPVSLNLANHILENRLFIEVLLAPGIEHKALKLLKEHRKNLIILVNPALSSPVNSKEKDIKKVRGGVLVQDPDQYLIDLNKLVVTTGSIDKDMQNDILFAWNICRISKSNSIVLAKNRQLVGSGVGQQDRKRTCELAVKKAGERANGAVAASDAFFPFNDGPKVLIDAGVKVILHPGGSIKDQDTIDICKEAGVTLVTTGGIRCFRH